MISRSIFRSMFGFILLTFTLVHSTHLSVCQPANGFIDLPSRVESKTAAARERVEPWTRRFDSRVSTIPTEGLRGYWPFNGNANDESGEGNHGTLFGATSVPDRFGNPNSAYDFDGSSLDYVVVENTENFRLSSWTVASWINVQTPPATGYIIASKEWDANFKTNFGFSVLWTMEILPAYETCDSEFDHHVFGATIDVNGWYFAVMSRDEQTGDFRVYVNGQPLVSGNWLDAPCTNSVRLFIGGPFDGLLDDIRIYDRALSDSEILELYNEIPGDPLAQLGICYGSTGSVEPNSPGALISIDPSTGAGTLIGPTGIIGDDGPAVRALAIKSTGEMYAMSHTASSDLYSVNASTGTGTFVANTGLLHPGDICFDAEDILYAVDETNILYTIDETTGVRTVVGATGVAIAGLAYDPTDGRMYGSGSADDIYTIDLESGAVTLVGTTGLGGNTPDIHFDQAGNLFGVKRGAGGVYDYIAIDKATGAGALIGSTGFVAVVGLATRLVPPSAIPCADVANFQTRCQGGGTIQARLTLANTNYTGEIVEFSIDGSPYQVTVGASGRANLSVGIFDLGLHTVEVTIPAGCVEPVTVRCRSGIAMEGDELWDDEVELEIPIATTLLGNYPNPFNPSTTLRYGLSEPGQVSLKVYNMLGQLVRTIVDEHQVEGYHEAMWDGRNESGATVATGIYVYRMVAGSFVETKKLLLVK